MHDALVTTQRQDWASVVVLFFFQAEDGIRDYKVTGVQTCALPIFMPSPRHARRSSPRPGRSTLMTSAPRSAMSVAQYGPAMTRERSRTWIPSSIVRVRAAVEEALRHRVDLGDARAGDGVDPRLGFRQRPRGLGGEQLDPRARLLEERRARHDAVEEAHLVGVGGSRPSRSVFARSKRRRNWLFRCANARRRSSGVIFEWSGASAPAQKTGGAPVTITTRVAASSRSSANAAPSSVSIASLSALRRSGRFSVTVAIAPSRARVTLSPM